MQDPSERAGFDANPYKRLNASESNVQLTDKGVDYVALLATLILGIVASLALYYGNEVVAGTAVGAVGGFMNRLWR